MPYQAKPKQVRQITHGPQPVAHDQTALSTRFAANLQFVRFARAGIIGCDHPQAVLGRRRIDQDDLHARLRDTRQRLRQLRQRGMHRSSGFARCTKARPRPPWALSRTSVRRGRDGAFGWSRFRHWPSKAGFECAARRPVVSVSGRAGRSGGCNGLTDERLVAVALRSGTRPKLVLSVRQRGLWLWLRLWLRLGPLHGRGWRKIGLSRKGSWPHQGVGWPARRARLLHDRDGRRGASHPDTFAPDHRRGQVRAATVRSTLPSKHPARGAVRWTCDCGRCPVVLGFGPPAEGVWVTAPASSLRRAMRCSAIVGSMPTIRPYAVTMRVVSWSCGSAERSPVSKASHCALVSAEAGSDHQRRQARGGPHLLKKLSKLLVSGGGTGGIRTARMSRRGNRRLVARISRSGFRPAPAPALVPVTQLEPYANRYPLQLSPENPVA